jgi:hypothetical protein
MERGVSNMREWCLILANRKTGELSIRTSAWYHEARQVADMETKEARGIRRFPELNAIVVGNELWYIADAEEVQNMTIGDIMKIGVEKDD